MDFKAPWEFKSMDERSWVEHPTVDPMIKIQAFDPIALSNGVEETPRCGKGATVVIWDKLAEAILDLRELKYDDELLDTLTEFLNKVRTENNYVNIR